MSEYLITNVSINTQSELLSVIDDDNNQRYSIEAANNLRTKLSANYKFLGLGFGFSPHTSNRKSKFLEARVNVFLKQWILGANFSRIKGFYAQNDYLQNVQTDFPDLKSTRYTLSTSYNFNDKFSLKHLIQKNEWQRTSAGSFVPSFTISYNRIFDLVDNEKYKQHNYDFSILPTYHYTWCIDNNWFIAPSVTPKAGVRFSSNSKAKNTFFTRGFNFRLQFGITTERVAVGAIFNFESNNINYKSVRRTINDRNHGQLYFAYRFDAPKFLERTVEGIERKLGI
ncbi:DUF4421 family protein [Neotamlana nanhaiensis]|uniref:DUF4421 family protein n=1 Tax=Neotamlana nanhaiensis TaxID=1382798 RepID=UPI0012FEAC3F|nr:DUF4421 family protein [Tamlana nanhaiensis]